PGEDAALFDAVEALALGLCPALHLSVPVGKDSLSMQASWRDGEVARRTVSPVSPVVTAFARIEDVRGALTPELRSDEGTTELLLLDLSGGRARLGGSILAEVHGRLGEEAPDVDDPARLRAAFEALRSARARGWILAYHDRSDGGALVAALEMAFAGRSGLDIAIDAQGAELHATLFNEELGLLLQVRDADVPALRALFAEHGLGPDLHAFARPVAGDAIRIR